MTAPDPTTPRCPTCGMNHHRQTVGYRGCADPWHTESLKVGEVRDRQFSDPRPADVGNPLKDEPAAPTSENIREAIRFAEEYGYTDWQSARDDLTALEQELAKYRDLCQAGDEDYLRVMAERDAAQAETVYQAERANRNDRERTAAQAELAQVREALAPLVASIAYNGWLDPADVRMADARRALADGEGTE